MNVREQSTTGEPVGTHPANQPDEYVRCPYFPEHELRRNRLPYHIMKCQRNPMAPKLLICPYNFLHRIRHEDHREHLLLCEDKLKVKYVDKQLPSIRKVELKQFGYQGPAEERELVPLEVTEDDGLEW